MTEMRTVTVPAPSVPFPGGTTDAEFMRSAADNLEGGYEIGGSNLTSTVRQLLAHAAAALALIELAEQTPGRSGGYRHGFTERKVTVEVPAADAVALARSGGRLRDGLPVQTADAPAVISLLRSVADALDRNDPARTVQRIAAVWQRWVDEGPSSTALTEVGDILREVGALPPARVSEPPEEWVVYEWPTGTVHAVHPATRPAAEAWVEENAAFHGQYQELPKARANMLALAHVAGRSEMQEEIGG